MHVRVHCILSVYVRGGAQGVIDILTMCYKNSPAIIHSVFNIIQSISYSQYQMDKKTWHATKLIHIYSYYIYIYSMDMRGLPDIHTAKPKRAEG